ncbi:MAG: hypothetical protein Q9166_002289 [cf. Caloplaca sp. 2 TL-2023]
MEARYTLVQTLLLVQSYAAVEEAHKHVYAMLFLRARDDRCLRFLLPALSLRLGRDQDCYDRCKWWAVTASKEGHDLGNPTLPFLDIQNANVLEPLPRNLLEESGSGNLGHTVAMTILKAKLLYDVTALHNSTILRQKLPQEILNLVRKELMEHSILSRNRAVMNAVHQTPIIRALEKQVQNLYLAVWKQNKHYWPGLFDPEIHMKARPATIDLIPGSVEQMQLVLQHTFDTWLEAPVALDMIRWLHRRTLQTNIHQMTQALDCELENDQQRGED